MTHKNNLFPAFINLVHKKVLIIGGGKVGLEKLHTLLYNAPEATIVLIGKTIGEEIDLLEETHSNLIVYQRAYQKEDIARADLVISAVGNLEESEKITRIARQYKTLVNAADKPQHCDFYLGAVVRKGNLKIAISTNGLSPTIAKRFKEFLNEIIPDETDQLLHSMNAARRQLKTDLNEKIARLNKLTATFTARE